MFLRIAPQKRTNEARLIPKSSSAFLCLICLLVCAFGAGVAQAQDGTTTGPGVIIVYVMGRDGQAVGRMFDVMLSRIGFQYNSLYQRTAPNGVAEFNSLAIAPYRITVSAPGFDDGGAEIELTIARLTATVTVTVDLKDSDSSDEPAKGIVLAPKARKEAAAGLAAMQAGHYDEARQHLEAAYKMAPGNPEINDMLGELYLTTKDFAKAQTYLQRAISIEPDNASALSDMGYLQIQQKDYVLAEINLLRAVSLAPQNWQSHWLLGMAYLHLNQPENARDEANVAIKDGKDQAFDAEYLLGETLAVLGNYGDAMKALDQFLKEAPTSSNAPAAKVLLAKLQSAAILSPANDSQSSTPAVAAGATGGAGNSR